MATDEINVTIEGGAKAAAELSRRAGLLRRALVKALARSGQTVRAKAVMNVSGRVLNVRTGRLRNSLVSELSREDMLVRVGTSVKYGPIHEFGGRTAPHLIVPRTASVLAFPKTDVGRGLLSRTKRGKVRRSEWNRGLLAFARVVHHPGSVIPERPFLRPALADSKEQIRSYFREAMQVARGVES